ncbi:HDIG domain-containing protein [Desulfovibrio sp. OttesenSCG-928-M14]|nr:HDIG domain-containing protein [Desulfovibrio sp. OttesenSCG-928-M14]
MPVDDPSKATASIFSSGAPPEGFASEPFPLPDLHLQGAAMTPFDPARHLPERTFSHGGPSVSETMLPLAIAARAHPELDLIPGVEDCHALWDRYHMLDNIRSHSTKVADMAHALTMKALSGGAALNPDAARAAGLLHDLGKTYTIKHGGNHAQLGASWVMRETGNARIARAVMFHVYWPFVERFDDDFFMVMAIIYADKRTRHDSYVSLGERFDDLVERYAVNEYIRERIILSHAQGKRIEAALSRRLGVNLDECIADCGRLVQRT